MSINYLQLEFPTLMISSEQKSLQVEVTFIKAYYSFLI